MFLERLLSLCSENGTDISNVLRSLGLSTSKGTAWRSGSIPNGDILLKLANYFHVSTDYLLGSTDDPQPAGQKGQPAPVAESGLSPLEKRLNDLLALASDETKRLMIDLLERMQSR